MRDIDILLKEIIPPDDYQHREGFNNVPIIDSLTSEERGKVEYRLIALLAKKIDYLVIESLVHIKSRKAVSTLKTTLLKTQNPIDTLIIAWSIFAVTGDNKMRDIALEASIAIDNNYSKAINYKYNFIAMFDYMAKMHDARIDKIIKRYLSHKDILLSHNARHALSQ